MQLKSSKKQKVLEPLEEMEYIKKNVEPIFSTMMVKIINEEPKDVMGYMLQYLKNMKKSREA